MPARLDEQISSALRVEVPAETRESVRAKVMEELDRLLAQKPAPPPRPRRPWDILKLRLLALGSATIVVAGAGTAVAAASAGPDSWLYPVKQDLESVRADLARGSLAEASYQVDRAGKRLDEVDAMIAAGKPQYVPDLLSQYDAVMQRAAQLREEAAENGKDTTQVDTAFAATVLRHDELLESLSGQLPDDIRQQMIEAGETAIGPEASEPHEDVVPPNGSPAGENGNAANDQTEDSARGNGSDGNHGTAENPGAGGADEWENENSQSGGAMEQQESSYLPPPGNRYERHSPQDEPDDNDGSHGNDDQNYDDDSGSQDESGHGSAVTEHAAGSPSSGSADGGSAAGASRH